MITPKDLVEFFEKHDCYRSLLPGWTREHLIIALSKASVDKSLAWMCDDNEKIIGVCLGMPEPDTKIMHITALLCDQKKVVAYLLNFFNVNYSGWTLSGRRGDEIMQYNGKNINRMYKFFRRSVTAI